MAKKRKYTPDKGPLNRVSAIYKGKTKDKTLAMEIGTTGGGDIQEQVTHEHDKKKGTITKVYKAKGKPEIKIVVPAEQEYFKKSKGPKLIRRDKHVTTHPMTVTKRYKGGLMVKPKTAKRGY